MIIDNKYENMKTVEIDICTQKKCCLMPTQNQTEGFTQASIETHAGHMTYWSTWISLAFN